jgi:hypothetical protein
MSQLSRSSPGVFFKDRNIASGVFERPLILIVITRQAQKNMPVGALHLLGLTVPGRPRNSAARGRL